MNNLKEYQAKIRAEVNGPVAAVGIAGGTGRAFFRRPTQDEWDEWLLLSADGGSAQRTAYARLVSGCFLGAWTPHTLDNLTFDQVVTLEGPAFIGADSGAGGAVNKLAGAGVRDTEFL